MRGKTLICAVAVATTLWTVNAGARGETSVAAARELYTSAAYDDALTMLNTLLVGSHTGEERHAIDLYRILCLVGLSRTAEADRAIEALITSTPLYRPPAGELSPRMQATFSAARTRMLPSLIQQQYADGKAAFDRQDFAAAVAAFRGVLDGLADSDVSAASSQPPLSDLRMLAKGFHELSAKALAPPPPPPVVEAPPVAPPPPAAPPRDFLRLYSGDDRDVIPPVIIRQSFPTFNGVVVTTTTGVIEVIVDTAGDVDSAVIRIPIHPQYDRVALTAAKQWKYQAATVEGVPVKFVKAVRIVLTATR